MNPFAEQAKALADRGFRVFPLVPGSKRPAIKDWQHLATCDHAIIDRAWGERAYNIGILTGHGLVGLDIDVKDGKDGEASFRSLAIPDDYLDTFIVRTPSGGRHVYFKGEGHNSASSLGPGLDVRGDGGFLVGPGSVLSNGSGKGAYVIEHDTDIRDVPSQLFLRHDEPVPSSVRGSTIHLDDAGAVTRARDWLASAKPAVEGQGGDDLTYRTAAQIKDFGVSEGVAFELLFEWNARCEPPWHPDELKAKVAGAYHYGQNPPGSAHPAVLFEGVAVEAESAPQALPGDWTWDGTEPSRKVSWLFPKLAPLMGVMLLVGPPNSGKTFLEIEIARCAYTGKALFGIEPKRRGGTAFLFAGTEGTNFLWRLKALGETEPMAIACKSIDELGGRGELGKLVNSLRDLSVQMDVMYGVPLRMVVLETLSASGLVANENDPTETGRAIKNLGKIAQLLNVLVVVAHHPPKETQGVRGSGALTAGADYVIEIRREGRDTLRRVDLIKGRDAEQRSIGCFSLLTVRMGEDEDGDPIESCVVSMGEPERIGGARRAPPRLKEFNMALDCTETMNVEGMKLWSYDDVVDEFRSLTDDISQKSNQNRTFNRIVDYAKDMGVVEVRLIHGIRYFERKEIIADD